MVERRRHGVRLGTQATRRASARTSPSWTLPSRSSSRTCPPPASPTSCAPSAPTRPPPSSSRCDPHRRPPPPRNNDPDDISRATSEADDTNDPVCRPSADAHTPPRVPPQVNDNADVRRVGGGTHWSLLAYLRGVEGADDAFLHFDSLGAANATAANALAAAAAEALGGPRAVAAARNVRHDPPGTRDRPTGTIAACTSSRWRTRCATRDTWCATRDVCVSRFEQSRRSASRREGRRCSRSSSGWRRRRVVARVCGFAGGREPRREALSPRCAS